MGGFLVPISMTTLIGFAGFLAIPGFASNQEVAALRQRARELVDDFDPSSSPSVFSTRNQACVG